MNFTETVRGKILSEIEKYGYDKFYQELLGKSFEITGQNMKMCSPFPYSEDTNPSFWISTTTWKWNDAHSIKSEYASTVKTSGDAIDFYYMMNSVITEKGTVFIDYNKGKQELFARFHVTDDKLKRYYNQCRIDLSLTDIPKIKTAKACWTKETLAELKIGYDKTSGRLVLPFCANGEYLNHKAYNTNLDPKMLWGSGLVNKYIFPEKQLEGTDYVIVVEGEPDVISLRSLGFNAICSSLGSSDPVPPTNFFANKNVFVCTDKDDKGVIAQQKLIDFLKIVTERFYIVAVPDIPGMKENHDISDYIIYNINDIGLEDTCEKIKILLKQSIKISQKLNYNEKKVSDLSDIFSSGNINTLLEVDCDIDGLGDSIYSIPSHYRISCSQNITACNNCPIRNNQNTVFSVAGTDRDLLALIDKPDVLKDKLLGKRSGIPFNCNVHQIVVLNRSDFRMAKIISGKNEIHKGKYFNTHAVIKLEPESELVTGSCKIEGVVHEHPDTQKLTFVGVTCKKEFGLYEQYDWDDAQEVKSQIDKHIKGDPYRFIYDYAENMSASVTGIKDRTMLHLMYLLTYHSSINYSIEGTYYHKGWIDSLVIGDTRCGKTETYRKMAEFYREGVLVDTKNSTVAGLLAGVDIISGNRFVSHGIFPRNDGKIVCVDEYTFENNNIIRAMASARSEGVVRLDKIIRAELPTRVRMILLANPGAGKLIAELPFYGIELVKKLIEQPEDIARFDLLTVVKQGDVDVQKVISLKGLSVSTIDIDLMRKIMYYSWKRNYTNITFHKKTTDIVTGIINNLDIVENDMFQVADRKNKIIRCAIAIANMCCAVDNEGNLFVDEIHIETAGRFYKDMYGHSSLQVEEYRNKFVTITENDRKTFYQELNTLRSEENFSFALDAVSTLEFLKDKTLGVYFSSVILDRFFGILLRNGIIRPGENGFTKTQRGSRLLIEYAKTSAKGLPS